LGALAAFAAVIGVAALELAVPAVRAADKQPIIAYSISRSR
jgi:hypothetical protein